MRNWDVTIAQLILLIVGGYYVYQALQIFATAGRYYNDPQAFVFTMTIGIILVGMSLALQQIRSYRAKKGLEVKIV